MHTMAELLTFKLAFRGLSDEDGDEIELDTPDEVEDLNEDDEDEEDAREIAPAPEVVEEEEIER